MLPLFLPSEPKRRRSISYPSSMPKLEILKEEAPKRTFSDNEDNLSKHVAQVSLEARNKKRKAEAEKDRIKLELFGKAKTRNAAIAAGRACALYGFMVIWFMYFGAVHLGYTPVADLNSFLEQCGMLTDNGFTFTLNWSDIVERQIQNPPVVLQDKVTDMTKGIPHIDPKSKYWPYSDAKNAVNGLKQKHFDIGNEPINLFLVPHSHLDPGWIETFEDYYYKKVKAILINVINELWNKDKKFTWCETSFLHRFWTDKGIA